MDANGVVAPVRTGQGDHEQIEEEIKMSLTPPELQTVIETGAATNKLGIKLDTVIAHIRSLREKDPQAKIVLFSAWTEALNLCCTVLDQADIRYAKLDKTRKNQMSSAQQFQHDPDIAVFILHAQSQAAGLNLTAAKTIIMIEPLLNPALELQIIARVHRIGQKSETQVFQYVSPN
jgi:E3 ubiquitin-protein ligase SHPRH